MRAENFLETRLVRAACSPPSRRCHPVTLSLKVTLAWDDVPGTPNVDPALVNDLDLHVYAPTTRGTIRGR
jgi:hypothetical protein